MGHIQYIIKQREAFIREDYRAEEYSPDEKSPRQVFLFQNDFMLYDLRGTFEKRRPLYQWADSPTRMMSRVSNIRLDGVQESVRSIRIISLRAYQFLLSMPVSFFWPLHAMQWCWTHQSPLLETCNKKESWRRGRRVRSVASFHRERWQQFYILSFQIRVETTSNMVKHCLNNITLNPPKCCMFDTQIQTEQHIGYRDNCMKEAENKCFLISQAFYMMTDRLQLQLAQPKQVWESIRESTKDRTNKQNRWQQWYQFLPAQTFNWFVLTKYWTHSMTRVFLLFFL